MASTSKAIPKVFLMILFRKNSQKSELYTVLRMVLLSILLKSKIIENFSGFNKDLCLCKTFSFDKFCISYLVISNHGF